MIPLLHHGGADYHKPTEGGSKLVDKLQTTDVTVTALCPLC